MEFITLDEYINEVKEIESRIKETECITGSIAKTAEVLKNFTKPNIAIYTDYDADGITSGYIMQKTLSLLHPDKKVSVYCSDRRSGYGVTNFPRDIIDNFDKETTELVVCDMGSNELDFISKNLTENAVIIDHHQIEKENIKTLFTEKENLLNPHAYKDEADYCTAGLSFRLFENLHPNANEKLYNTMNVMACIGTVADVVDLLDINSNNRFIVQKGIDIINNADENNLDFVLGYFIGKTMTDTSMDITSNDIGFNIGSFLNAPSRMSYYMKKNGAQMMLDTLLGDKDKSDTYFQLDKLKEINAKRKSISNEIQSSSDFLDFVKEMRMNTQNVGIYVVPESTPHSLCGIVAGKLADYTDKAIIVLTEKNGTYSGSGRNPADNPFSLLDFVNKVNNLCENRFEAGGHKEAVGISNISDLDEFMKNVTKLNKSEQFLSTNKALKRVLVLDNPETDISKKLLSIEPIQGLNIPPVVIRGTRSTVAKVSGREDWRRITIDKSIRISDWCYDEAFIPKTKGNTKVLANVGLSSYNGIHSEYTVKFNKSFVENPERYVEKKPDPGKEL